MFSCKLKSHPDTLLAEHLVATAKLADEYLADLQSLVDERLTVSVRLSALCHDLGKATSYFQEYLDGVDAKKSDLVNHGFISATAAYITVKEALAGFPSDIITDWLPFLAYAAVRRHHGNLKFIKDEMAVIDDDIQLLLSQLDAIDSQSWELLSTDLKAKGFAFDLSLDKWRNGINMLPREFARFRRMWRKMNLNEETNLRLYTTMNLIYSLLIDADKSAVGIGRSVTRPKVAFTPGLVDTYKSLQSFTASPLNALRQQAYEEVVNQPIVPGRRIYELTLPTGMGKTFSALAFAFKLRAHLQQQGLQPRIIYALPFLSIIEQNAALVEDILKSNGMSVNSNVLLKHHHLAENYYRDSESEYEPEEAKLLTEGWNSELIITTFVQLFHTLFGFRNRTLRKFHRLMGSVLVLDEVQAIPVRYWPAVREFLMYLANKWNVYVVLSTATQPKMFDSNEVEPLVNKANYFSNLNRVVLRPMLRKQSIEEFVHKLQLSENKSYLFVMNTIKAAKQLYELLKERLPEEEIAYLTTHVVPIERFKRIQAIRQGQYRICVSTQLVEAGVDIDFDVIYRDMAPLDRINQTAGRCNRNGFSQGEVYVVNLADDKRSYAHYVYDLPLLDLTHQLLEAREEIPESQFMELVDRYYSQATERMSKGDGCHLLKAMSSLDYDRHEGKPISAFKLINNDYPKMDVFVEIDKGAQEAWKQFTEITSLSDPFERRAEFARIKSRFYSYVVSIPRQLDNLPPVVHSIGYVSSTSLADYYDRQTGYRCEAGVVIW